MHRKPKPVWGVPPRLLYAVKLARSHLRTHRSVIAVKSRVFAMKPANPLISRKATRSNSCDFHARSDSKSGSAPSRSFPCRSAFLKSSTSGAVNQTSRSGERRIFSNETGEKQRKLRRYTASPGNRRQPDSRSVEKSASLANISPANCGSQHCAETLWVHGKLPPSLA